MTDRYGRTIDYMRVSVTDRCNLRCKYCMPQGVELAGHGDILSYEELLRLCAVAVSLGITKFKITGGEPLVRKGCVDFIRRLKATDGVEQVTITTNGLLLGEHLDGLCAAGIDGINISLDTLDEAGYKELTGSSGAAVVEEALLACVDRELRVKTNTVLLRRTFGEIGAITALAGRLPVDVRFIELMPIGEGVSMEGVPVAEALNRLRALWPDLRPTGEQRGNGPAVYYKSGGLRGRIGVIRAVSGGFCDSCNRVRLTAAGVLKPCLCYENGADFRELLRDGRPDAALREQMAAAICEKPRSHCFGLPEAITEKQTMNRIGG